MSFHSEFDLKEKIKTSFLFGGSAAYLEEQYEAYLQDPSSVDPLWRQTFDALPKTTTGQVKEVSHQAVKDYFEALAKHPHFAGLQSGTVMERTLTKQCHVLSYIRAYRESGHRLAKLDPLDLRAVPILPALELSHHDLSDADFSSTFDTYSLSTIGKSMATLKEIDQDLKQIYCQSIGIEYMYIQDEEQQSWIQAYIEPHLGVYPFTPDEKKHILSKLIAAEGLERYLGSRFVGQKRFSLEGGDSFIPMLDAAINRAATLGIKEVAIGMAHRGRLNVLVNIMGKAPEKLFAEFEGHYDQTTLSGDVKYHKGYASAVNTPDGTIHLVLGFNPSHLEIIAPVLEGSVKARQDRRDDVKGRVVLPIIVHGDAAFSGQGVVMENFALGQAEGFITGGTIHVVINNQVGFTTDHPLDTKQQGYSTDIAKMVDAPIIHVNGDDPEAVVFAMHLALDFRMRFEKDVVIDLVCYRRFGHNEADEPSMTQPVMYQKIKAHPTTLTLYSNRLIEKNILSADEYRQANENYREALKIGQPVVNLANDYKLDFVTDWTPYWGKSWQSDAKTSVPKERLQALGVQLNKIADDFMLQPQVAKEYENRKAMIAGELPLHWGMAETLAYASLLEEGYSVRMTGQDIERGTFSHRHAVLHDLRNNKCFIPLTGFCHHQNRFSIYDSILSEEAVLGFEYGYASASPQTLTIWEAQYGDFYNGAQMVVDQFISSSEQKWGLLCGLVMNLPHGLEGGGPEHSSARLERFLQLCAQDNMQVVVPTTPAQCFHLLRRQMIRDYRKPLIVMSPKSLLRHKAAVSTLDELSTGHFQPVIDETEEAIIKQQVTRLIFTMGKIYYDLVQERSKEGHEKTAIIRIEQLYPFPDELLRQLFSQYPRVTQVIFCQDEPKNQGAWVFCQEKLSALLNPNQVLSYVGRPEAAAPAVGSAHIHIEQQQALLAEAFSLSVTA